MASTAPPAHVPSQRSLWVGFLAGPLLWSAHFLVGYLLTEVVCATGLLNFTLLGLPALSGIILVLTVVALLALLYAAALALRNWRRLGRQLTEVVDPNPVVERSRFMVLAGLLLTALFAVLIVLGGAPALVLPPCATAIGQG